MIATAELILPRLDGTLQSYQLGAALPCPQSAAPARKRSVVHLSEILRLADRAKLLRDPDVACRRMQLIVALAGVGA